MASVASQLIEEVTSHAQSDSLDDVRQSCADGTYFPNNLSNFTLTTNYWQFECVNIIMVFIIIHYYDVV